MKNIHLSHPEDSILTGDLSVLNWFTTPGDLSVKLDGSIAIVWGKDPATGTFFVGTKSVFNKRKIMIPHSHEEIDQFYDGEVAEILHSCFDYLPRVDTIYQGDFIGFGGKDEYTPNVVTYKFPEVVYEKIIIAPHTCYYAEKDLRDAVAMPDRSLWVDTENVKFVVPNAHIFGDVDSFDDVKEIVSFAKQMSTTCEFITEKKSKEIKKQINDCIREQREVEDDAFDCDPNLIRLWKLVKSIKEDCLYLCRNNGPDTYIGYDRVNGEGYVFINEYGMFKLVKREVFSYNNFKKNMKV